MNLIIMQKEIISLLSGKADDLTGLLNMEKEIPNEEIRALYFYELSIVSESPAKAKYQSLAISLYKSLLNTTPKYEYELKIKSLS